MALDRPQGSPGGVVGGTVQLTGGKKALRLTGLKVHMLYVSVQSSDDGGLPKIDTRIIGEQVLAAGVELPPGSTQTFTFRVVVPPDTRPSAHNVSYRLQAIADIPGVKDPSAEQDFAVVPADRDANRTLPLGEVLARFPGLQARDEDTLCQALESLNLECYSNGGQFLECEPLLSQLLRGGNVRVRRTALRTWASLVDNRVQPQHLQSLYGVANVPGLDQDTFDEVIAAACRFAEEGAFAMVQQLAASQDPRVRKVTAEGLRFHAAARFQGKRELLLQLVGDPDPLVRAAAVGAFGDFRDDAQVVYGVAGLLERDAHPEVGAACIAMLSLAHHHGYGEVTLGVFEKHVGHPQERVREAIAENLYAQPESQVQRVGALVQRLAQDPSERVRRSMAFQFVNLERFPALQPLVQWVADNDPSEEVRTEALRGMARITAVPHLLRYYQHKLSQSPRTEVLYAVIGGLREHYRVREAQQLLTQLGQHPDPDVANAARDALSG
ncbi:MAG: HEAT repeat domain-containing protein [Deltaproteobacteria bacterium]|nr:HEAT repeat domain-containing protein [Deltaproteobacteria bacterium]